jgi:hypothetical protein
MNQYKPGQAQPQQQSQGTPYQAYTPNANERPQYGQQPSAPRRPDFAPPQSDFRQVGEAGAAVMTRWYNPQTGQTHQTGASNYQPVEGSGWVRSPRGGQQPGGDTMYAGGTPYFNERTGQATPNWSAPQGANERISPMQPPPFQMAPAQTPWGASMDPFAERDAFVNQINQQRMQNQIAFNSGGPTNPAAGMTPGIDYQLAMQQAGLAGGAPSMSPEYGDSLIARLNSQFGGSPQQNLSYGNPSVARNVPGSPFPETVLRDGGRQYYTWALNNPNDPRSASIIANWEERQAGRPAPTIAPPSPDAFQPGFSSPGAPQQPAFYPGGTMNDGYGMGQPPSLGGARDMMARPPLVMAPQQGPAPGYGTPPEFRGMGRTADWRDADGDRVDDRDQDGPGMPPYPRDVMPVGPGSRQNGNWPRQADGGLAPPSEVDPALRRRLNDPAFWNARPYAGDPRSKPPAAPRPTAPNRRDVQAAFENPSAWQYQNPQEAGRQARSAGGNSQQAYNAAVKNNWLGPEAQRSVGNMSQDNQRAYLMMGGFNRNEANDYSRGVSGRRRR